MLRPHHRAGFRSISAPMSRGKRGPAGSKAGELRGEAENLGF
jgi:hypothetical protein